MEYCKYCEVNIEDNHADYTCWQNELNYLMCARTCDPKEWETRESRKKDLKDLLSDEFVCEITGKSFDTLEQVLEHERVNMNAKVIDRQEKMYKSISCPDCGKKFYDRGQKMPVKYLLNRHKKKCGLLQTKNLKITLKQWIAENDNVNKLKKMLAIANSDE
tara:strand:+ start:68 stop:550 length:483 start_codon:yes stop_codon:yes gene_type:complete